MGQITALRETLDLSRNRLIGTISSELAQLTHLTRLLLNSNQLRGNIPTGLSQLVRIREIRLDDNDLTGLVPAEVCSLYETTMPLSYADCTEVVVPCFTYCCVDQVGCTCRFQETNPFLCVVS